LLVTPTLALFEDHHADQNAYGSIGSAIAFCIEYTENGLIYTHYNLISELVMPGVIF
jgi:hypothetical protein